MGTFQARQQEMQRARQRVSAKGKAESVSEAADIWEGREPDGCKKKKKTKAAMGAAAMFGSCFPSVEFGI